MQEDQCRAWPTERDSMNQTTKDLALKAGFKIFGNTIVAADNGSSGDATKCLAKFAELLIAECVQICKDCGSSAEFSYTPAKALVARRTAESCATIIEQRFAE